MRAHDLDDQRLLTSHEVSRLLQVNPTSIKNWVDDGRLPAFRTPGGHRRIRVADLVAFLRQHGMPVPRPLAGAARRRLLIVDDDALQLRALERRLKRERGRLELALTESGIDALLLIGSFAPDVVVLDVFMPGLDGIEVCRRIKRNPETRHIGVVVTSGHPTRAIEAAARAAGAQACLAKPIDVRALLATLELAEAR